MKNELVWSRAGDSSSSGSRQLGFPSAHQHTCEAKDGEKTEIALLLELDAVWWIIEPVSPAHVQLLLFAHPSHVFLVLAGADLVEFAHVFCVRFCFLVEIRYLDTAWRVILNSRHGCDRRFLPEHGDTSILRQGRK